MPSKRPKLHKIAHGFRMHSKNNLTRLRNSRLVRIGISDSRTIILFFVMLGLIVVAALIRQISPAEAVFRPSDHEQRMPLSGWAVHADTWEEERQFDTSLVYAEVTWAELEKEEGVYDFEAFEEKNHLKEWWNEGKRVILRVIADRPGEEGHIDIPVWLVEEMGGIEESGTFYQSEAGSGFTPDYSRIAMREAHRLLIEALADRYEDHPGVAYIEIGSLGNDGEWSVEWKETQANPLPVSTVSREYAWHYTKEFINTPLLMCRPYKEAQLSNVGLFNPRLGDREATWNYLDAIQSGGYDRQIETDLVAMPDFYLTSPSGAHIPEELDLERLLTEDSWELARQIFESRLDYVVIDRLPDHLSKEAIQKLQDLECLMGSQMWIRSAQWDARVHRTMRSSVYLTWRNDGVTPMHVGWPIALALFDGEQMLCCQTTELNTRMILPGEVELQTWIDVPYGVPVGTYTLKVAILDPDTMLPGVPLMMEECDPQTLWTELGELSVIS